MRNLLLYISILSFVGCNLFQGQQQVEENTLVKEFEWLPVEEPEWPLVEDILDITEKKLLEAINDGRGEISDTTTFGKFFTIERIPRQVYQQALKHRYDFLKKDSLAVKQESGVMTLPCKKKTVTLLDEGPTEDTGITFHNYLGEIPDLEQYVVLRVVYRSFETLFIDKQTGAETEMGSNPLPTPDSKYVVDVYSDYYSIILTLYKVEKKGSFTFKKLITLKPHYWLLDYDEKEPEFFSNDGYLYMPTICRYFSEDIDKRTYVRIGIKNQSSVDNK